MTGVRELTMAELWEKDKTMFDRFDFNMWNRYYQAINRGVPVDEVHKAPYYLMLTDNEKLCYQHEVVELAEERKSFPRASYEVRLRDFD